MRIVTNRDHIQRNRRRAQTLFFLGLGIWITGLLVTNAIPQLDLILFLVPCVITPLGLGVTAYALRLTNEYVRVPRPDEALQEALKGTSRRSALYSYILKQPHVLVTPQGVYSLTTRFQETRVKVEGERVIDYKRRGPLAPILQFLKQEGLGKPFEQARAQAAEIQLIVDEAVPEAGITVQPIVVFISPKATLEVNDPVLPVVYADPKRSPSLKATIRSSHAEETEGDAEDEATNGKAAKASRPAPKGAKPLPREEPKGVLSDEQIERLHQAFMAEVLGEAAPANPANAANSEG